MIKMKKLQVFVTDDLAKKIQQLADEEDRSLSAFVRMQLRGFFKDAKNVC